MPLEKVWIEPGCITCNACEILCPGIFEVGRTTSVVRPGVDLAAHEELVIEAAESCPVEVIRYRSSPPEGTPLAGA